MKKDFCKACNTTCGLNFNDDNGYKYVLDELKSARDSIDSIIHVMENRIEKDAVINEVLNTDYEDESCECDCKEQNDETIEAIINAIAIQNALNSHSKRRTYPWWTTHTTWF